MKIYKNLFSNDFCDILIEKIKNECVLSESHKINWFIWLVWGQQPSQPLSKEKWNNEIYTLITDELFKTEFEKRKITWIQMTEYENGRWMRRHIDGGHNKTSIILLSNGFTGGDTYINDKPVKLEKGDGVLFDGCTQFHEVKPVTEGIRYALNCWFT
jgi:hypothetical protein